MQQALTGTWSRQPHFSIEALTPLHDLNHRFLDLLAERSGSWLVRERCAETGGLGRALAALTTVQRAALGRCPYALFDLRFSDEEHWRDRLERPPRWRVEDAPGAAGELTEFVHLTLFYAWHVASTAQLAAQVLLGMHMRTAQAFRAAALSALPALAASEAVELKIRWGTRHAFWSTLIRAASRGDSARLRRAQLFGLQLAAAARLP
jgi:hypothetical protein